MDRDLPPIFGPWKSIYNSFNTGSKHGILHKLIEMLREEIDNNWNFVAGAYVKAHQHASGGFETPEEKTTGKSKGGNAT